MHVLWLQMHKFCIKRMKINVNALRMQKAEKTINIYAPIKHACSRRVHILQSLRCLKRHREEYRRWWMLKKMYLLSYFYEKKRIHLLQRIKNS
jgi:hypothetical protein